MSNGSFSRKSYLLILAMICIFISGDAQIPNSWARIADFGGTARTYGVGFSIDSFGYAGLGTYENDTTFAIVFPTDLWQYNPYMNIWTQKSNFPGSGRKGASCFVIGSKAYICAGNEDGIGASGYADFWEYNSQTDTWTQKADFKGGRRTGCLAFSIGGYGYVGMGYSDTAANNGYLNDLWKYDTATDTWTQLANFPGQGIEEDPLFGINGQEYVGFGALDSLGLFYPLRDLWKYDPSSDSWTRLSDFIGDSVNEWPFSLTIGDKGYMNFIKGTSAPYSDYFWEYNPVSDSWVQKDSFSGGPLIGVSHFTIGNNGYVGSGTINNYTDCTNDFWVYTPDSINTGIKPIDGNSISISPNPTQGSFTMEIDAPSISTKSAEISVINMMGQEVIGVPVTLQAGNNKELIPLSEGTSAGVYVVQLTVDGQSLYYRLVLDK